MNKKQTIAAFDFDGTITKKDTFLEFIRFAKGKFAFLCGFTLYSPLLIAYKLKLYPNWKVKQQLFSFFFQGMPLSDFNQLCCEFSQHSLSLIRPSAIKAINQHLKEGDSIVIISAGIENWIRPFANQLGISSILCTEIETDANNCLTGRFATANCYGKEKIRRLLQLYPQRSDYYLIAYGDSKGDKVLLEAADEKFYKELK